jgi:hypothetical protein
MVLRLLAYNAEGDLARRLNAYLADPDEYRAITRNLLHQGGRIHFGTDAVTVTIDPAQPAPGGPGPVTPGRRAQRHASACWVIPGRSSTGSGPRDFNSRACPTSGGLSLRAHSWMYPLGSCKPKKTVNWSSETTSGFSVGAAD